MQGQRSGNAGGTLAALNRRIERPSLPSVVRRISVHVLVISTCRRQLVNWARARRRAPEVVWRLLPSRMPAVMGHCSGPSRGSSAVSSLYSAATRRMDRMVEPAASSCLWGFRRVIRATISILRRIPGSVSVRRLSEPPQIRVIDKLSADDETAGMAAKRAV